MKRLLTIGFLFITAGMADGAFAQMPPPRMISVSGEADAQAAPDRAVLAVSLASKDADLSRAKADNDKLTERVVAVAREFKIPKEKLATSGLYIAPEYTYNNNQRRFVGYTVSRSLRITMDELPIHERVLSALIDAKVDQIGGVEFQLQDPEAHAAALRVKAFENAKAKAEALAKAAGARLGPVLNISTDGARPPMPPMPMMARGMADMAESSVAPSLPGMIELRQSVQVTFALE